MKPLEGASVKCIEVSMVYPLHRVINYQYLNGTTFVGALKGVSLERSFYKGFTYHMSMVFINRYPINYIINIRKKIIKEMIYELENRINTI
jgi:hypothetical protein